MRYGHKFITPLRGGVFVTTSAAVNQQGGEKNHSTASDSAQSLANLHSECVCVCICVLLLTTKASATKSSN